MQTTFTYASVTQRGHLKTTDWAWRTVTKIWDMYPDGFEITRDMVKHWACLVGAPTDKSDSDNITPLLGFFGFEPVFKDGRKQVYAWIVRHPVRTEIDELINGLDLDQLNELNTRVFARVVELNNTNPTQEV